jgi:glycosyltransferase involved in cell wall biosynthesis
MKISAVIIAGNEEQKIGDAIKSVDWADEVLVIDSESTDRTRVIAESLGARVIVRPWPGFSAQKQFGADSAANEWIFSLDADERVSEELKLEIIGIKERSGEPTDHGYRIPRLSSYMGRQIRHSGWYPDWQLRLFDRRQGKWNGALIHESVQMSNGAKTGKLKGDIIHLTVESALQHHTMIGERYSPLAARQMFERGKRTSKLKILTAGWLAFVSSYVIKAGFLDGMAGFCIARFAAHHAFLKHMCLAELQHKENTDPPT